MKAYLENKRFFLQGSFHGLEETVHAHTLADAGQPIVNCFSLETEPVEGRFRFRPADIGLPPGMVQVEGAAFRQTGNEVTVDLSIPCVNREFHGRE